MYTNPNLYDCYCARCGKGIKENEGRFYAGKDAQQCERCGNPFVPKHSNLSEVTYDEKKD